MTFAEKMKNPHNVAALEGADIILACDRRRNTRVVPLWGRELWTRSTDGLNDDGPGIRFVAVILDFETEMEDAIRLVSTLKGSCDFASKQYIVDRGFIDSLTGRTERDRAWDEINRLLGGL
jgi:hypothetical protein